MKKHLYLFTMALIGASLTTVSAMEAPARVHDLAKGELQTLGSAPVIVAAVAAQNARGISLAEIRIRDQQWMATPGLTAAMQALIDSPAGMELAHWRQSRAWLSEVILMDKQGANVAMTEKTSDYWQGDEAKFTEAVKEGGRTFVDRVKFDESSQTYSVQVSLPVMQDGAVIGVICFGIDVEQL